MVEISAGFGGGHIQVQQADYKENPRVDRVIPDADALRRTLSELPGVTAVSNRTETFAVVSKDEKSYAALVVGVDPAHDAEVSFLSSQLTQGSYLEDPNSAFIGDALARNLELSLGDEIVIMGSDAQGSIAFMVPTIAGIFDSGNSPLDRSLVQIPRATLNEALNLGDAAHRVVLLTSEMMQPGPVVDTIAELLPEGLAVYDWSVLMPEIKQSIDLDKVSNGILYGTLTLIVVLSIANTFVMTMFERTREFGMLRAVGMRTNSLFGMFLSESMLIWLLGVVLGLCLSLSTILPFMHFGISLDAPMIEEIVDKFFFPDRIYPAIDLKVLLVAPLSIGAGMLLSTALASIRLYRLSLVEALRYKE